MTEAFLTQTDFSAGELDPRMRGRTDLRSYQSGAAKLRNVVVETTGGVRRRPGLAAQLGWVLGDLAPADAVVRPAFAGGAQGVALSQKYSEMRLDNLAGAGDAIKELTG